ncbi:MAG: CoA-binding protein [Lacibacter sp.]
MVVNKKTLVLGASANPNRYSYIAVQKLRAAGHDVIGIGKEKGIAADIEIKTDMHPIENLDTITLYLNPSHQNKYIDYMLSLHPKRIIFNPGTENEELYQRALKHGILPVEACTLVMLSTGQY